MTTLMYVTPHPLRDGGLPTRTGALLEALAASGAFSTVVAVNRVRPDAWLRRPRGSNDQTHTAIRVVEHPWPFGSLERWWLARLARSLRPPLVCWIADPKSAIVLGRLPPRSTGILDAYDAWELSPLVRGGRRRRAVMTGYRAAARHARLIFANTPAMAERLRSLGARDIHVLPNAAPAPATIVPDDAPSLAYVGRIHERFACDLVAAVADALPDVPIRIVGPIERAPQGWASLIARPNIHLVGPLDADGARAVIGRSRGLLLPHTPDPYTRSQDAMKAWDALSVGAPVLSTSVPPAVDWPADLAIVADDPAGFAAAAGRLVAGALDGGRDARMAYAAANGWPQRAATVLEAIHDVTTSDGRAIEAAR